MRRITHGFGFLLVLLTGQPGIAQEPSRDELTTAVAAKVLASAVFVSKRDVNDALENSVHRMISLFGLRPEDLTKVDVDRERKQVTITIKNTFTRTARFYGDQGCVVLPKGSEKVSFTPVKLRSRLPDPATQTWPMGDQLAARPVRSSVNGDKLNAAIEKIFRPENRTAAFVVVHRGAIIAERYGAGADKDTQLESWSMGKSLTAILYGVLVADEGAFDPFVAAPIPEWQGEEDSRARIQIAHLLRMSSGLEFSHIRDPASTWKRGHPDHFYVYSGAINVFDFAASRPAEFPPDKVGRYRNCDPLLIGRIIRQKVEARGESYLSFPQRALFDRIGIRRMVLETDLHGNFVLTGYDYGTGRNWARLGLLMLQDGVWQGKRILPEGFVEFVSKPAPAWTRRQYGGLFWVNGNRRWNLPESAYYMAGHGGQRVLIVPTHELVIVRMGHQQGGDPGTRSLNEALPLITAAVPAKSTGFATPSVDARAANGWIALFDGKTLSGWTQRNGTAKYTVENRVIVGTTSEGSPNSFLCTNEHFADFELKFEVRVDDRLNSGVQIRSLTRRSPRGRVHGPQVEISTNGNAGFIYGEALGTRWLSRNRNDPVKNAAFKKGEWNSYRVKAVGERIQTWINGVSVADLHDTRSKMREGFIGLQVHSVGRGAGPYQVRWRNIQLKDLSGK